MLIIWFPPLLLLAILTRHSTFTSSNPPKINIQLHTYVPQNKRHVMHFLVRTNTKLYMHVLPGKTTSQAFSPTIQALRPLDSRPSSATEDMDLPKTVEAEGKTWKKRRYSQRKPIARPRTPVNPKKTLKILSL